MPLNKKGKKIKRAMVKQYGKKKGESVFYAMENSGKLKKVLKAKGGMDASQADFGGGSTTSGGNGRDPSKQYDSKNKLSPGARQALQDQKNRARGRISPSTTAAGNVLKGIGFLGFGLTPGITGSLIDRSPMAFGVPGSTKGVKGTKDTKGVKGTKDTRQGDGGNVKVNKPVIAGPIPIAPQPILRRATVSPTGSFGYSVGLKKGGLLRQGKPKLAKKGWK